MSELRALIEQFVDNRESLSQEQLAELVAQLRGAPTQVAELKDHLLLDEILRQQLSVDGGRFAAQVDQRLRDEDRDADELLDQVTQMRDLAAQEFHQQWAPARRRRPWRALALAASVLLAAGAYFYLKPLLDAPRVVRVEGAVTLVRDGDSYPLEATKRISRRDELRVPPGGLAVLRFKDQTEIQLGGDTIVGFQRGSRDGKSVQLQQGSLSAKVTPQPAALPMRLTTRHARATVLGTELLLAVDANQTRLDVAEGSVEMVQPQRDERLVVAARQSGLADAKALRLESLEWPVDPASVVFSATEAEPPRDWLAVGSARFDSHGAAKLDGGVFQLPQAAADRIVARCRQTGEVTIEIVLAAKSLAQTGPARVLGLSGEPFQNNFLLGQEGSRLVFEIRTSETTGAEHAWNVAVLEDREPHHVLVCYKPGRVESYVDGRHFAAYLASGDLAPWENLYLLLGDEAPHRDPPPKPQFWRGEVRALAVYSRCFNADQAMRSAAALHHLSRRAQ